jgi:hypothetical protein
MQSALAWMRGNLTTQGYRLTDEERRELWLALRFSTGTCLALVVTALVLESPTMIFVLSGIGLIASFSPRHPFDLIWNYGARHIVGQRALPPNPARRRHAFKIATVWLMLVGGLFLAGVASAALAVGGLLVAACATVTAINFCLPSEALDWWQRRGTRRAIAASGGRSGALGGSGGALSGADGQGQL